MSVRFMGALRAFIARKGPMFVINHLVLAPIAFWLVWRIVESSGQWEKLYLNVRLCALALVAIFGYLSLVLGRRGNARLLPCFALAVVASEILLRAMGSYGVEVRNDRPWREPRPYFMFGGPSDGRTVTVLPHMGDDTGRAVTLNSEGFRIEREIADPKPADELRIFVLGGSTVAGGHPLSATIPGVIEAHLQAHGLPQARVYNFGVVSFISGQELALLVHRLIDLQPDVVVAYDGGNDMFSPWFYDPRPGYPFNYVTEEEALNTLANAGGATKTLATLARDSALLQALFGTMDWFNRMGARVDVLRSAVHFKSEAWQHALVDAYARNMTVMCRFARANNALFAGYFQPMLPYAKTLDSDQVAMSGGAEMVQALRAQRVMALQAVAARFPPPSVEAGCRFSDLSGMLEDKPGVFGDIIHVGNEENELIGGRIADELLAWPALKHPPMRTSESKGR
jgi:hypothetical protein